MPHDSTSGVLITNLFGQPLPGFVSRGVVRLARLGHDRQEFPLGPLREHVESAEGSGTRVVVAPADISRSCVFLVTRTIRSAADTSVGTLTVATNSPLSWRFIRTASSGAMDIPPISFEPGAV